MSPRRTLRQTLGWIYVVASGMPLLLLGAWGIYHTRGEWERERQRLAETAGQARDQLEDQVQTHLRVALTLARDLELAGVGASAQAGAWLDHARQNTPGFLSMSVADRSGRVVASSPAAAVGSDVSDRTYFTRLAEGAPWTVSNAFRGRVLGAAPIAAVSAEVRDSSGAFAGIVQGALRLQGFSELERRHSSLEELRIVVLDGAGAVVYGGRDDRFEPLLPLPDSVLAPIGAHRLYRDPTDGHRWLVTRVATEEWGWQVLAMQPVSAALANLRGSMLGFLAAAAWSLIALLVGMRIVVVRAIEPVERLVAAMRNFRITDPPAPVRVTSGTPAEIVELARTYNAMAERTRRVITGLVPICAECKRIRDEQGNWESVEAFVQARSEAEFTHGMCPDCAETLGFPPVAEERHPHQPHNAG